MTHNLQTPDLTITQSLPRQNKKQKTGGCYTQPACEHQ
jgi:hypothetical protein